MVLSDQGPRSLSFHEVNFAYDTNREVLKNCSFELKAGEMVALVGTSGVGKSTVIDLLYRFHKPQSGSILLNEHPIETFGLDHLREQFSLVSQESYLFYDTIKNNLLIGNPDVSDEELIAAAKVANIHEWITSLPDGYNTITGERGIRLSGGEKQRIAIARAILKNAPVLLLDEPTSSIDAENERLIQDALENLCKNRTVLIIAHRLSTIRHADRIMVMGDGKIQESGSHEELLSAGGQYARLVNAQMKMLRSSSISDTSDGGNI